MPCMHGEYAPAYSISCEVDKYLQLPRFVILGSLLLVMANGHDFNPHFHFYVFFLKKYIHPKNKTTVES